MENSYRFPDLPRPGQCRVSSGGLIIIINAIPKKCLGIGMAFMPYSPRWLMEQGREEEALSTLSMLRRKPSDHIAVRYEFLEIKAEILYSREASELAYPNAGPWRRFINNYIALVATWPKFKRLAVGCLTMFYQQFIVRLCLRASVFFTERSGHRSRVVMCVFWFFYESYFV